MKRSIYITLCCFVGFFHCNMHGQELFPGTEPASTIPKGVLGLKAYTETYKELSIPRNMVAARAMYGLTSRLSVYAQASASNHHNTKLPADIINHRHIGSQTVYYSQNRVYGQKYPYTFNGFYIYAKYRFFSRDGENKHFRMAAYAEASKVRSAHDEAEPNLIDDCSGIGGGLIITQLYKRFAVSLTTGYIKPSPYSEGSADNRTVLYYGDAVNYSLSFGYRFYPKRYSSYYQDNYNIYLELAGKSYNQARLLISDQVISVESSSLKQGRYLESRFGVQRIINSNTRLDLTVAVPFIRQSYVHFYPVYMVGCQHYFYGRRSKVSPRNKSN